jgi:hypothetical protein
MNLTKTQKAMLLHLAGKAPHNLATNHALRAKQLLRSKGLAEYYSFTGLVCGHSMICWDIRLTESGKKLAEQAFGGA